MRFFILLLVFLFSAGIAKETPKISFLDSIKQYVDSLAPTAKFGLSVRSLHADSLILGINGNDWFVPASTMKLLVTAAALNTIPLDYSPKTLLHFEGIKKNKTFSGMLRIEGRGDPNISARYYPDANFVLSNLADSLKSRGIDTIKGLINLDTAFYKGSRKPATWRKNFFDSWYGAEISSLSFNDNCVLVEIKGAEKEGDSAIVTVKPDVGYVKIKNGIKTSGKRNKVKYSLNPVKPEMDFNGTIGVKASYSVVLPVRNPAGYFKAAFLKSLEESGIYYNEDSLVYKGIARDSIIFKGPPLKSILDEINQRSQNLHAEMLLRNLGQWDRKDGSVESGILSEYQFLLRAGLPASDFSIIDGSGLSPTNKLKPNSLTLLLTYMLKNKLKDVYVASLAIPKVSGAGKRLANAEFSSKIRFKTGFIEGVHGLAGYIFADGDTLAFALYLNNAQKINEGKARDILDTIAARIAKKYNEEEQGLAIAKDLWKSGEQIKGVNDRINFFSKKLLGTPYFLGPMGDGRNVAPSFKPRVNFNEFDCVTFMEPAIALAYSKHYEDFYANLQKIRYKDGVVSYAARNHFFIADWVWNNKSLIADFELRMDSANAVDSPLQAAAQTLKNDTSLWKIFDKTIYKKKFFNDSTQTNPTIHIPYIPKNIAIVWADTAFLKGAGLGEKDSIFGIAILSDIAGLDAAHTGFGIARKGKPVMFRHASQLKGKAIEQPLSEFLKNTKIKTPGIAIFKFNDL